MDNLTIRIKQSFLTDGGIAYSVIISDPVNNASIEFACIGRDSATKFYMQFINLIASDTVECIEPLS